MLQKIGCAVAPAAFGRGETSEMEEMRKSRNFSVLCSCKLSLKYALMAIPDVICTGSGEYRSSFFKHVLEM